MSVYNTSETPVVVFVSPSNSTRRDSTAMPTTDIEICPHDVHPGTSSTPDHDDAPKHDQHAGLRRVAGPIPWLLFLICVVEVRQTIHSR
jgi:hypothetical protein